MSEPTNASAPPTFEEALSQLQQIVLELEDGNLGLESSLARFEEGIGLLRSCYQILEQAEQKIEILIGQDAAGNPLTAPFDATATFEGAEKPARKPGRRRSTPKGESPADNPPPAEPDNGGDRLF
ncbi:MAG: exodeoxyribonuclease VII small subunit [Planctomycetia bacterium]|nr:exodeoxyribonuclease VII small subunit [Planctomycetia bacterium]